MPQSEWTAVDNEFQTHLVPADPILERCLRVSADAGLPPHSVSPLQGKLLQILAQAMGARTALEIGTLGGYSSIWIARALPADGKLVTLEIDAGRAALARDNLRVAGLAERAEVRCGDARELLARLTQEEGVPAFDFVFIDADKKSNLEYLEWTLRLTRPGSLLVFDNVVRDGAILDKASSDESVQGLQRMNERLGTEPRVSATAIQTVGCKGYDGFILARVLACGEK